MKRRVFLGLAGSAALLRPNAARAQRQSIPVIGILGSSSPDPSAHGTLAAALREGLNDAGLAEGRHYTVESRWANGNFDLLPELARGLAEAGVTVLATIGGDVAALAAKKATSKIPIVFVSGSDPVRLGLVESFNRPGANVTGVSVVTSGTFAKRLEILLEMVPGTIVVGILVNRKNPNADGEAKEIEATARSIQQSIVVANASSTAEFEPAIAELVERKARALLIHPDAFFTGYRQQLVSAVARHKLPAIYHFKEFASAGGLVSYGADFPGAFRIAGGYVAKILRGETPANLPVQQPNRFELVINLKTAKEIGVSVPPTLLARADEVIE
jgi:putative tryptophan/tyrosine transport system substrate-binding protein